MDNIYYSDDHIEKNEMGAACNTQRGGQSCIQGLVGKREGKRPLGRPTCRWEVNIKMDIQEVRWEAWNRLIWLRTGTCKWDNELLGSIQREERFD